MQHTNNKKDDEDKKLSIPPQLEWYYEQKILTIPLVRDRNSKNPKKPLLKWKEFQEKKLTREEIAEWVNKTDRWAVVCGEISDNLVVIDVDNEETATALNFGELYAKTYTEVRTNKEGKRRFHIFLRTPKPIKNKQLKFDNKEEISIRFNANLAVAGGTSYPSGGIYQHFPTSPKQIKTVETGLFDDLEKLFSDYHGLSKEGKKGFAALKKGVTLKANITEIIKQCVESEGKKLLEFTDKGDYCQCRCPLPGHVDPVSSFTIYKKTKSFYCFGCYKGGNAITFVTDFYGISKKEAIERLKAGNLIEIEKGEDKEPSIEDIKSMDDFNGTDIIANYVIYKKVFNGLPRRFIVKVYHEDGEIKEEVDPEAHSIPEQTAPTVNFYDADCNSFKEIFDELKGEHQDYVAFAEGSIYPTLTALGSMASYFREAFYTYPYFDFISGEAESGKTTAMKTQVFTSFYGTVASSVSEALLFREIDKSHCFYGLDNIERLFTQPKEYAGIIDWLLSSYARDIPCRRLAKVGDNFEVVSFDGYGEKAFTHIADFPVSLSTLKSRCIQIVMQKGKPTKYYPTPEKFAAIRDKIYNARIREYQKVREAYEELVQSNILTGRTGDLYYPLLAIAKLIDEEVYEEVLEYAKKTEKERTELNEWNRELIRLLYEEGYYGSISPKDIRKEYEDKLRENGLLNEDKTIYTRTVTNRLKKLGFTRDSKKTENKTWFVIDQDTVFQRAYEYGILNTPQIPNLPNLPNSEKKQKTLKEEKAGEERKKGAKREENDFDENENEKELTKLRKLTKRGDMEEEIPKKQQPRFVNIEDLNADGNIRPEALDKDFQDKQSKEARKRLEEEGLYGEKDCDGNSCCECEGGEQIDDQDKKEKLVTEAITEILEIDPDFLTEDEDHAFVIISKLGEQNKEVDEETILKVLESERKQNGGSVE